MTRQKAQVEPAMLSWGRARSSLPLHVAAKRAGVKPEKLEAWESGEDKPTIRQLRLLARAYGHLSIAVFYLPEPPKDFTPLRDFRRLATAQSTPMSTTLLMEHQVALERRDIALNLYDELQETPPAFKLKTSLTANVPTVAESIRATLGITYDLQRRWKSNNEAFNAWRSALEDVGVLVFQAVGVAVKEMRGMSISMQPLPAVVVNRKDAYAGRIFSALHELTHVMLHSGGLCNMRDDQRVAEDERVIEVFCNAVAGETIVPQALLREEAVVVSHQGTEWTDGELKRLATVYGTSKEAVLRRLLDLGLTSDAFYRRMREVFARELEDRQKAGGQKTKPGFLTPDVEVVSQSGKGFVRLNLEAFHQGRITASTLADYLGVRLKHMPSIEDMVQK